MELWGWLASYVVLFALLHLVLYYVYITRESDGTTAPPALADPDRGGPRHSPTAYPRTDDPPDPEPLEEGLEFDGETVTCSCCGARNETGYTYCWNCISTLR